MTWDELDWMALDRLRAGFLEGATSAGAYWNDASDLASYDFTYGERIGWKWDQVLRELKMRGWAPASRSVLDWGCGSGIASRRVISFFGVERFDSLSVWDHSPVACDFAVEAAKRTFPTLDVAQVTPGFLSGGGTIGLLVVSHVLNELTPESLDDLRALALRADAVLWVEPGTHVVSRSLGALRETLRQRFHIVAPCTHQLMCPMFAPGNERHWCHHFAPPPAEIFANSEWVKFGQRMSIDLRSLPYCFLALDREQTVAAPLGLARVIGRPEHFKPYARLLNCDATGLAALTLLKRTDPGLYKQLERTKEPLVYRWRREGNSILGVET